MIFVRKISKILEFYTIFARIMPEFCIIIALTYFSRIWGDVPPTLPPSLTPMYSYILQRRRQTKSEDSLNSLISILIINERFLSYLYYRLSPILIICLAPVAAFNGRRSTASSLSNSSNHNYYEFVFVDVVNVSIRIVTVSWRIR